MPEITEEQLKEFNDSKANVEKLAAEKATLEKDLETTRMEVLTPEYTKFLESLEKKSEPEDKKKEKDDTDEFSKLTPKELFEKAKRAAVDEIEGKIKARDDESEKEKKARTATEIKDFAKDHPDFEQFRPIMYGLSLDKKNADLKLSDLYNKAKNHVKSLQAGSTDEDKDRGRRIKNEKPGSDSSSLDKLKKMTNEEIAQESLDEVSKTLGPIPQG